MTQEQLDQRLQALKAEFTSGQHMLAEYEAKQAHLRETLLRISGAIQVLEEIMTQPAEPAPEESRALADLPREPALNGRLAEASGTTP